jgi:hypothetical protein
VVPTDGSVVTYYNGSQHYLKVTVIAKALSPIPTLKIIADDDDDDGWINPYAIFITLSVTVC